MLSASEARQATEQAIDTLYAKELAKVEESISGAISNGEYFVDIYGAISNAVSNILNLKGYKVTYMADATKPYTKISW